MLITVCDVPEERRSDAERAGGEVVRIYERLIDVQFNVHTISADKLGNVLIVRQMTDDKFYIVSNEYSRIYIQ